jgi:hypothetical protein
MQGSGNDPDAKPVCGTPQAERNAAAVVPSADLLGTSEAVARITTRANEALRL